MELTLIPREEFERARAQEDLALLADMCRANALVAVKRAGSGHLGSSFSAMDIVVHLLYAELNTAELGWEHHWGDFTWGKRTREASSGEELLRVVEVAMVFGGEPLPSLSLGDPRCCERLGRGCIRRDPLQREADLLAGHVVARENQLQSRSATEFATRVDAVLREVSQEPKEAAGLFVHIDGRGFIRR